MFEILGITLAEFEQFVLILVRVAILLATLPLFNSKMFDNLWRAALGMFLAFICAHVLPISAGLPVSFLYLIFLAAKEALVGRIIGTVCNVIFEGVRLAGLLTGQLMSLSMMSMVDPNSEESTQVISELMYFVALLLLFSVDGHHFFLQALFDSFYRIPVQQAQFPATTIPYLIRMSGDIFSIGLRIGAPVYAVLYLERILLALFAKMAPQMHVLIVALPLGILVGLYMLMLFWPYFAAAFMSMFGTFTGQVTGFMQQFAP